MVSSIINQKKLFLEFCLIYFFIPLIITINFREFFFLPSLLIVFLISIILLKLDKNFNFRKLLKKIFWKIVLKSFFAFFTFIFVYILFLDKNLLFQLPINNPRIWVLAIVIYPVVSVIPQEFIFRVLFYQRYEKLFSFEKNYVILINSITFGFSHIVFTNFHSIILSTLASTIFSIAYLRNSFFTCIIVHSLAGQLIFTLGLGKYFFNGTIGLIN